MAERLVGKCAVVTGAASGMGKAIAIAFLKEGAKIVAADVNTQALTELEAEVAELGAADSFKWIKCNVTDDDDCAAAVKLCADTFGTCNVLSHNAGIVDNFSMVDSISNELWDRTIAVNLTGSMKIARASLRYFLANDVSASMVMITSNAAFESATGGPSYSASKAGANALMKSIAFEYGRKGIRCNSICPGPVLTNIHTSMGVQHEEGAAIHTASGYNAHCKEWIVKSAALALGTDPALPAIGFPHEIAPLAVYLASDESTFVNAASIVIDGGVCLSR